jgi:hypothetical protein
MVRFSLQRELGQSEETYQAEDSHRLNQVNQWQLWVDQLSPPYEAAVQNDCSLPRLMCRNSVVGLPLVNPGVICSSTVLPFVLYVPREIYYEMTVRLISKSEIGFFAQSLLTADISASPFIKP